LASIQFVTGLTKPTGIAFDAQNVFVTDSGTNSVWQVNKASGAMALVASGQDSPAGVAADGSYVYWTSGLGSAVLRAQVGSSQAVSVLYSASAPNQIAVDATNVYWLDGSGLHSGPKAGGGPVVDLNTNGFTPTLQAQDSGYFYGIGTAPPPAGSSYLISPALEAVAKVDGSVFTLHVEYTTDANLAFFGTAVNASNIYFVENVPESTVDFTGLGITPYAMTLFQISKYGKGNASYGIPVTRINAMTADDCSVYWTSGTAVFRFTPGATPPLALATNAVTPGQIVVDDANVYWIDQTWIGRVRK
jgi:hypothetical protein